MREGLAVMELNAGSVLFEVAPRTACKQPKSRHKAAKPLLMVTLVICPNRATRR